MKKLQMRIGNNAPLDINQEYEETQNNEIDELAQMYTSPSIETPSKNETNTDDSNTENSSNTVNVSVDNIIPSKHNKFKQYEIMKKRSGTRTDLQENAEKSNSLDELARKHGASRTQMHRLIRIADLDDL